MNLIISKKVNRINSQNVKKANFIEQKKENALLIYKQRDILENKKKIVIGEILSTNKKVCQDARQRYLSVGCNKEKENMSNLVKLYYRNTEQKY
jgi:hypothetical protein